jgi:hypothetical protein
MAEPSAWRYAGPASDTTSGSSSLTASATVISAIGNTGVANTKVKRNKKKAPDTGKGAEAWEMYRQVGELRYVANAIAGRVGKAVFYVEKDGVRLDEDDEILSLISEQIVERLALNLYVAGKGYLAGIKGEDGTSVEWGAYSVKEVKETKNGKAEIKGEKYAAGEFYLIDVVDPDPEDSDVPDSPVLSSLPVLRELVGLTMHSSSQIDSRLAGAGVYWIPNSILASAKVPEGQEGLQAFSQNPVLNAIMNAMLLPMEDRSNASAVVPLLMGAPDEAISKIRYDTFSTPFDKEVGPNVDRTIRRLGLGLDAPPELLQGMGDANHWGMWLVRDEVIQAHVAPRADLIADALTTGFYRPIEVTDKDVSGYVVKAAVDHLVQRPNRLGDAQSLHSVNAISDKALREAGGFDPEDAPSNQDRAISLALTVASANPQLLDNLPEIVAAVKALLDGTPETGPDQISSQRQPGSLRPLVPGQRPAVPPATASAPNGTPTQNGRGAATVGNPEEQPASGPPAA